MIEIRVSMRFKRKYFRREVEIKLNHRTGRGREALTFPRCFHTFTEVSVLFHCYTAGPGTREGYLEIPLTVLHTTCNKLLRGMCGTCRASALSLFSPDRSAPFYRPLLFPLYSSRGSMIRSIAAFVPLIHSTLISGALAQVSWTRRILAAESIRIDCRSEILYIQRSRQLEVNVLKHDVTSPPETKGDFECA
jgi:hypothetical protein